MNNKDRTLFNRFINEHLDWDLEYYVVTILELLKYSSKSITEIEDNDINGWISYLKSIKVNDSLIQESHTIVNQFFTSLYDKGLLTKNPTVHSNKNNLMLIS